MSGSIGSAVLCERCTLLNFDDHAIGGQESSDENSFPRLSFLDAKIQIRPEYYAESRKDEDPDYTLVRLEWYLDDLLPGLPYLSQSVESGCEFCKSLRPALEESLAQEAKSCSIQDGPITLIAYISLVEGGIEGLLVEGTFNQDAKIYEVLQILFPIEAESSCAKWLGAVPARHGQYLTPQNIEKMCSLVESCTKDCHPWTASTFLPTRLIDLGVDSSSAPSLVLSSQFQNSDDIKYAALSYCWGSEEDAKTQYKTETATLGERIENLSYQKMTPAIADAIKLTRAIGLRFIWIDALCIVQDDPLDWSHESGQMNLVYNHAFVTFCGLNSASCHETLLERAPIIRIPFQSTIRPEIYGHYWLRLSPRRGDWQDRSKHIWDCAVSKWDKRGWTYQEKELSTRLLLFGGLRMHFMCGRCRWSEGDDEITQLHVSQVKIVDLIADIKRNKIPVNIIYTTWLRMMHAYGTRSVTRETDRLPAISGLARLVSEVLDDQYFAGLWKGDMIRGLDWLSREEVVSKGLDCLLQSLQGRHYVGPSWSGPASPRGMTLSSPLDWQILPKATVLRVHIETEPCNPFGRVLGGALHICGNVAPIPPELRQGRQDRWERVWWYQIEGDNDSHITAWLDWLQKGDEIEAHGLIMLLLLQYQEEGSHSFQGPQERVSSSVVQGSTEPSDLSALILHPAQRLGEYYRVGVIHSHGWAGFEVMRSWFEASPRETICII